MRYFFKRANIQI